MSKAKGLGDLFGSVLAAMAEADGDATPESHQKVETALLGGVPGNYMIVIMCHGSLPQKHDRQIRLFPPENDPRWFLVNTLLTADGLLLGHWARSPDQ